MPIDQATRELAKWRLQGHGVWYVTLVIDGHDDVFTHVFPGKQKRKDVEALARYHCSRQQKLPLKHVHVAGCDLKDLP